MQDQSLGSLSTDVRLAFSKLRGDVRAVKDQLREVQGSLDGMRGSFQGAERDAKRRFSAIGVAARVLMAQAVIEAARLAKQAIQQTVMAASDLDEALDKNRQIYRQNAAEVERWSRTTATSLGMSQQQALDTAGTIGQLYQNMGIAEESSAKMSMRLVKLAIDMAALNNIGTDEALDRIKRGVRGSAEALDELGISFTAADVKREALRMGLIKSTKEALEPATKAQAIYSLMVQQGGKYNDYFAKTADSLSGQMKILQAETADTAAEVGKSLLPVARQAVGTLREMVTVSKPFVGWLTETTALLPGAAQGLWSIVDPVGAVASVIGAAAQSFQALGDSIQNTLKTLHFAGTRAGQVQQMVQDANILEEEQRRVRGIAPFWLGGKATYPGGFKSTGIIGVAKKYGVSADQLNRAATPEEYNQLLRNASEAARARYTNEVRGMNADRKRTAAQSGKPVTPSPNPVIPIVPQTGGGGAGSGKKKAERQQNGMPFGSAFDLVLPYGSAFAFLPLVEDFFERGSMMALDIIAELKEKRLAATRAANEELARLSLSQFEFERRVIEEEYQARVKAGADEVSAARLKYARLAKLEADETLHRMEIRRAIEEQATESLNRLVEAQEAASVQRIEQMVQDANLRGVGTIQAGTGVTGTGGVGRAGKVSEGQMAVNDPFAFISSSMAANLMQATQNWETFADTFSGIMNNIKRAFSQAVAEMAAKWATMQIGNALGAFGGPFGAIFGALGGGLLGSLFGGFRAEGGPISPGRAYMVGERGPELIMPRSAGTVIPNHALGAMGAGNIAVHIHNPRMDNKASVEQQSRNIAALLQQDLRLTPAGGR